jgi:hypothetical protein
MIVQVPEPAGGTGAPGSEYTTLDFKALRNARDTNRSHKMACHLPFPVFDADNHMYETTDAFTKYLPQEYSGR